MSIPRQTDTGLRITISDKEGEVYVGPASVIRDETGNYLAFDDEDILVDLDLLLDDARFWAKGK